MLWATRLPLIVLLVGLGALSMLVPAVHAYVTRDLETARVFLYSSVMFLFLFAMIAVATSNYVIRRQGRSHLISLFALFAVLPAMLAVPFTEIVTDTSFGNAYIEMVSSLTTTGLTLFESERLPPSLHLWRALVAWLGGFFMWVAAIAIFAPLNLGGFEVVAATESGRDQRGGVVRLDHIGEPSERLTRFAIRLAPIYGGLTFVLWIVLMMAGDAPLVAICHAMSTLSTSGISPIEGGISGASSGYGGELLVLIFLLFALSRLTFTSDGRQDGWPALLRDPELRLGLSLIAVLPMLLFLRHWLATIDEGSEVTLLEGILGLWGAVFTVASFLTTTGFESAAWGEARAWSGLQAAGLVLMGLAVFGGGVATTAGGVKLLRVYALVKHGQREMDKLVMPSSVGGSGQVARRFRRQGAYVAWVFFMLFALSIATVSTALAFFGLSFEESLVLTIASLSTTGPLVSVAAETPIDLIALAPGAKAILTAAMVLGRLETLAIIALLNPEFWR
ncbi:MAG: TrkH family potassium uptake protein [Boseongicola sp.]|nr:TrkH family potassium uptake protein [Boseongicola sp.]